MKNENAIGISFSVDLGNTSQAFSGLEGTVKNTFGNINASLNGSSSNFQANLGKMAEEQGKLLKNTQASSSGVGGAIGGMVENLKGSYAGLSSSLGMVTSAIGAVVAAVGSMAWLSNMVEETRLAASETFKLSRMLNVTLQEASLYKEVLEDLGIETGVLVKATRLLSKQISTDSEVFKKYGIALKDQNGEWRTTDKVLLDVMQRYREFGNTMEANTFGQKIFSKSFADVQEMTRLTGDELERAIKRTKEYGLLLTDEQLAILREYKVSQEGGNDALEEFGKRLSFRVMPIFKEFHRFLEKNRDTLEGFSTVLVGFLQAIATLGNLAAMVWYSIVGIVKSVWYVIVLLIETVVNRMFWAYEKILGRNQAVIKMLNDEMGKVWSRFTGSEGDNFSKSFDKIADSGLSFLEVFKGIEANQYQIDNPSEPKVKPGGGESPIDSQIQMQKLLKALAAEEAQIKKDTIGDEEERYIKLKELYERYSKGEIQAAVFTKDMKLEMATSLMDKLTGLEEANKQKLLQIEKSKLESKREAQDRELVLEEQKIKRAFDLGKLSETDKNMLLAEQLKQRQELYEQYYKGIEKLENKTKIEALQAEQERLKAFRKFLDQINELQDQNSDANKKNNRLMLKELVGSMGSSFKSMLAGTASFAEGMAGIWNGLLGIVDNIIWKIVEEWILGEESKTLASIMSIDVIAAMTEVFHALMSLLGWESVGEKVLQEETKGTATIWGEWGAYPPVAIALTAGLIGILAGLAFSAKGGWDDVPFDGAMTSLHKGEMVLPQNLAEKVRNMSDTKPSQNVTYNITAMDAQSFKSFASKNKSILFNTHNSALRDGLQYGVRGV